MICAMRLRKTVVNDANALPRPFVDDFADKYGRRDADMLLMW
jgi:hypothetical protein